MNHFNKVGAVAAVFLTLLKPAVTRADILFIDANFSEGEVAAARKAALARHEKLIVIPTDGISAEGKALIHKIQPMERDYHERISSTGYAVPSKPTDEKLLRDLAAIRAQYGFDVSDIQKQISVLPPNTISSVVFSGHSEGTILQGMLYNGSELSIASVKDSLVQNKQFSVKSVYVWGCYSMTGGSALSWSDWKKSFPQMDSVALQADAKSTDAAKPNSEFMGWGFDTRAPSNAGGVGASLLGKLLTQEPALDQMKDNQKLLDAANQILSTSKKDSGTPASQLVGLSALVNGQFLSTDLNSIRCLSDLPDGCLNKISFLTQDRSAPKGLDSMAGCLSGYGGVCATDLPPSSDDHSSLRHYYDEIQHSTECIGHCGTPISAKLQKTYTESWRDDNKVPCPNDVIKLIKHDEIVHNTFTYMLPEMQKIDAALKGYPDLQKKFEAILKMDTTQPRVLLQRVQDFTSALFDRDAIPSGVVDYSQIRLFSKLISFPSCAPFSWIEQQETPSPPTACN